MALQGESMSKYIIPFEELTIKDIAKAGGKGASLGEMTSAGIPVPPGFVVSTDAFLEYSEVGIPEDLKSEILKSFDELGFERVAVRSSAIAEDSADASWAGQFESFLNVTREEVVEAVQNCWKSATTSLVKSYAKDNNIDESQLALAVVVMAMVESETSGVMFTKNPITNSTDEIMIEAVLGLGEMLVQGIVTPDNYIVVKEGLEIKNKFVSSQEMQMVYDGQKNIEENVDAVQGEVQKLKDEQIKEVARLGILVENHYGKPQDIEWSFQDGKCYIIQSRPITT
jgi:pyruvate,water dikinase